MTSDSVPTVAADASHWGVELHRSPLTVLVIDLVESVRLMQHDEASVVARWAAFSQAAVSELIPRHGGTVVKSLGDGLLVSFTDPAAALRAAADLHDHIRSHNLGLPPQKQMLLRIGVHASQVYVDQLDIYGNGVNLAARLATLAGPGETVVSAEVREAVVDGLDAHVVDLGDCYLKHVEGPTRVYRVGPAGERPVLPPGAEPGASLAPAIAVVPFESRVASADAVAVGDLIADGVIVRLSRARHLRVVSRLSTASFRGRPAAANDLGEHLSATYALTGSYTLFRNQLIISYELSDVREQIVVHADRLSTHVDELLKMDSETVATIVNDVHEAIFQVEAQRVQSQPLPRLESYSLMLGGIRLLHRSSRRDLDASYRVLDHLAQLHPRAPDPLIWKAQWFAIRAIQGLTDDRESDRAAALDCTARALNIEPMNPFALAMQGFVHCHLTRDYAAAAEALKLAVSVNPSEPLGQLFRGITQALEGDPEAGVVSYRTAVSASPLDPARYLFDTVGCYLLLAASRHAESITVARRALRLNVAHAHSWRILTIALAEDGQLEEARASLQQLLKVQPDLTLGRYRAGANPGDPTRERFAEALSLAGLT